MNSFTTRRDRDGYNPQEKATNYNYFGIQNDSIDRLLKKLTLEMVEGHRRPGLPSQRWNDDILMWCYKDIKSATMMAEERDNGERLVASYYGHCSPREVGKKERIS